jgi:PBP1b-binding outer membrane lipoprotein LpoB
MKKLLVILLALAVILTACAQKAADTAAPVETPAVETPVVEAPAEIPAEAPAEEAVEETPEEEAPAEAVIEAPTDEMNYEVAIGDSITYKDTTFLIDNIANSGNELYLNFNAFILKLKGLNKPEILNDVEYKIASNANVQKTEKVTLNVKPLKLEKNQYLIMKDKSVTVNGTALTLGEVKMDTRSQESAYFYINGHEYWIKLGDTADADNLSVTLDEIFYQQRRYAILTIVPK